MSDTLNTSAEDDFDPFEGPPIALTIAATEAQRELWTATQMDRDASLAFNEAVAIRVRGRLDADALAEALGDLLARHEALRATFTPDGRSLVVADASAAALVTEDWSALPTISRDACVTTLLASVVTQAFDLERGPLVRFTLARLAPAEHVLVVAAHHIICDGWSFGVIAADLAALYSARRGVAPAPLPADRFSDYARDLNAAERVAARAADERYWLAQFAGRPIPVLDLPTDRPRPLRKTYRAAREDRTLRPALARAVAAAGARAGASLFVTLLGGFATILHRLSGQDEVVVGVPSAGQAAAGRPTLVGHCVNTLPVRLRTDPAVGFDAFVGQVRGTLLDAFDHQALGFGSLLQRLPIVRDPARLPLISVLFNLDRELRPEAMAFDGLEAALTTVPRAYENFDLFLNAVEADGAIALECQYNADLFEPATVRRWLESYELLLADAAAAPGTPLGALAVLTTDDVEALAHCNDTALALPAGSFVHHMVESQAARTPDAVAVTHEGERLTYAELNARANRLARHLRATGVRRGTLVGLCLERSPELLVGLLAVLKAGGGYVPLDPNYPEDRLRFMAADANVAVLLTERRVRNALTPPRAARIVLMDDDPAAIAALRDDDLVYDEDAPDPESTAYVIYTSGSTGLPKGVLIPHRAVANLLASVQRTPGVGPADVVLAITTLSFDIAVAELLLPLTVGARIVLASRDTAVDGALLSQLINEASVTLINATPATYRLLLAAGWRGGPRLRLICTGEALARDLADALVGCASELWNGYGPTETTVWSTFARVAAPVGRILIGYPVANTRVRVLDAAMRQQPIGVAGELYIAGRGVANGYLNRPELTRERFLDDPEGAGAWYRTGDLARLLPDGALECLGRTDRQLKIRGFRIEPGEVETVLARVRGVRQAAVVTREDRPGDVRLVAYLIIDPSPSAPAPSDDALRGAARLSLPDYMVPNVYVRVDALPLTASGKVDANALLALGGQAGMRADAFVVPRTESERIVAQVWAEALGVPRISVRDDFFSLGGHSLLASQALARLRRDHGVALSFRTIFDAPTVERFAAAMDATHATAGVPDEHRAREADRIPHRHGADSAPLSIVQERLCLLEELDPAQQGAHRHAASWRFEGALDAARLEDALRSFIARHAVLRTSFHRRDGERVQRVALEVPFVLARRDLSELAGDDQQAMINAHFCAEQERPFNLATAPLLRATLLRLGDDAHLLYTLRHGLVWDGWSFDIFIRELGELYAAATEGRAPALPELAITYGDYAAWQRDWLAGDEAAAQTAWWRGQLELAPPALAMPTDRPRPVQSTHSGSDVSLVFGGEEVEALRTFAIRHDATLFMVVFAAYTVLLHRYTAQTDILVGTPVRARTRTDTENVVGVFVNTIVLRTRVDSGLSFLEVLRRVRETTLDSLSRQEIPFELLGTHAPVLRALFSMQDARARSVSAGDLAVRQVHVPQRATTNDLVLWTMESSDSMLAVLNYSTELFDRGTAAGLLMQLRAVLGEALRDPHQPVGAFELITPEERAVTPGTPADTESVAGQSSDSVSLAHASCGSVASDSESIDATIARHALALPAAPALRVGGARHTSAALAARSGRVAAALRAAGVRDGHAVGVALPLGDGQVTAVLGVLGAGGAVVLLDPEDPAGYQHRVLTAAGAAVVLVAEHADAEDSEAVRALRMIDAERDAGVPAEVPRSHQPWHPAAVLHTPGEDGTPVLAAVSHRTLAATLAELRARLAMQPADVVVATLPAGSPAALLGLLLPLSASAELVVPTEDEGTGALALASLVRATGATLLVAAAAVWHQLVSHEWAGGALRAVVADSIAPETLRALAARVDGVFVLYSLPNGGGCVAIHEACPDDAAAYIGEPLGGARLAVLDAYGRPVPTGMPGRLHVFHAPLEEEDHARRPSVTCTGDRARRRADGRLERLALDAARLSVDGVPVHAATVERVLRTHAAVADVEVAMHYDAGGVARMVAYLVPRPGLPYTDTELRSAIRRLLPRRCVPQRFVEVAALARDVAGEMVRGRLPSPFAPAAARVTIAPRTEDERVLADAWQEALGVDRVGIGDNFFTLGGSSLLCFRVIETVRQRTGLRLSPRALLVGTLEEMAAELTTARSGALPQIRHGATESGADMSSAGPVPPLTGLLARLTRRLTGGA